MLLSEAINSYERFKKYEVKGLTLQRYIGDIRQLCLALQNPHIESITKETILTHMDLMRQLGWTHNGIYKKTMAYRSFFRYLEKHGYFSIKPELIPKLRIEFTPPRIATDEEYQKLLKAIPKNKIHHIRNNAMIRLLWDTGIRNGELVALNVKDLPKKPVYFKKRPIYSAAIRTEKSRGQRPVRQIFWTVETHEALTKWVRTREEYAKEFNLMDPEALFIGFTNSGTGKRLSNHAVDIFLRKYSKTAKIQSMNAHAFRHGKARRIVEMGGTNSDVMNVLGHSNLNSSRVYTLLYGKELQERAEKFL